MDIRCTTDPRDGRPYVRVLFDTKQQLLDFHTTLSPTGKRIGQITRGVCYGTCGAFALKTLEVLNVELPAEFKAWNNKRSLRRSSLVSDEEIFADAQKYSRPSEWYSSSTYCRIAKNRSKELYRRCITHMRASVDLTKDYQVYVYEFTDTSAYVGLTCIPDERHLGHHLTGPVFNKLQEGVSCEFKVLHSGLGPDAASDTEMLEIVNYAQSGWNMLNSNAGGGLGNLGYVLRKYSFESILALAKQCKSYTEFYTKFSGPSQTCLNMGFLPRLVETMIKDFGWPRPKLGKFGTNFKGTTEDCIKMLSAAGVKTVREWRVRFMPSYRAARRQKWMESVVSALDLEKMTPLKTRKLKHKTAEECVIELRAANVTTVRQWKEKCPQVFRSAYYSGWIDAIVAQLKLKKFERRALSRTSRLLSPLWTMTPDQCIAQLRAASITSSKEWREKFPKIYAIAFRSGWRVKVVEAMNFSDFKGKRIASKRSTVSLKLLSSASNNANSQPQGAPLTP